MISQNHLFYFLRSLPYLLVHNNLPYSREKTYPEILGRTNEEKQSFEKHNDLLKEILAHHFYHQYKIHIHVTWKSSNCWF